MNIDKFLSDEQDPKAVEKVLSKLTDLLTANEELIYLAVQKKPAVNLLPDCIALTNKRLFYCEPANFGITMNFKDISWKSIKEVSFKEEIFGSKFICVPQQGENITTEYIPKVQARKLYQATAEQLEAFRELQREADLASQRAAQQPVAQPPVAQAEPVPIVPNTEPDEPATPEVIYSASPANPDQSRKEEPEDETTLKLRKLKLLYDKQLITLEEYEAKKASILDSF